MERFIFKLIVASVSLCVVSSAAASTSAELDETIKTIVETILNDRNDKDDIGNNDIDLRKRVEYLENKVASMETTLVDQNKTIVDLQHVISKLQTTGQMKPDKEFERNTGTSTKRNFTSAENNTMQKRVLSSDKLLAGGLRVKRAVGLNVAFSAYLTRTNTHVVVGHPVIFDEVLLNDGNGYDRNRGIFTVPLTGVYLFTFNFDARKLTFIRLAVNGVNQVDAVANAHTNAESRHAQSMGGNTAILHVQHGQQVTVEGHEIEDGETASSNTFRLCTFSGILLY